MTTTTTATQALPILAYREEILSSVRSSGVTIVTAETGAGKSTQVPQFLADEEYRVVVTQPRRLAARTLAQRVAHEENTRLGGRVGYRTAENRCDSAATEILFCTDGLQLVRELSGAGQTGGQTVLVLDEVHEWNTNMEVLVAWARQRIEAGDDLRVVLMSATLDAEGLSSFFGEAPVISVPGRLFPVEKLDAPSYKLTGQTAELAETGHNVLVFQPGVKEITETVSDLQTRLGAAAVVLPLHGKLNPDEQQRCFDPAPTGKVKVVVATNVAQTSVTIPDIDAVVDSGVERRIELVDGIEGLYLRPISQADCAQRAGRAGRTKAGVYILCSDMSIEDRPAFPTAEIHRSRLDQTVLRLAVQRFDATALKFFHQPDEATLADAKRALIALGAMSSDGSVTKIGRRMARFPVSVQFARMLIEAERFGVVEQVATIAACLEAGDIRARNGQWKSLTQESRSDLLAVLDVFNAGRNARGGHGMSKAGALREMGLFAKDFFRASEIRRKLLNAVGQRLHHSSKEFVSKDEEREAILRSCVAGMVDHLYHHGYSGYQNGSAGTRELARESVVANQPEWLVGLPFDISGIGRRGRPFTLNLVGMATVVDPTWLVEVAPHLAEVKTGLSPRYDAEEDVIVSTTQTFFNGQMVREETVADGDNPEAAVVFARWLSGRSALPDVPGHSAGQALETVLRSNAKRQERARQLNIRTGEKTFKVYSSDEMFERFASALSSARAVIEVVQPEQLAMPPLNEDEIARVLFENPDTINLLGSKVEVTYMNFYGSCKPQARLNELVSARWIELPDEGVSLPGGRPVYVTVSIGYRNIEGTDIPLLKKQMREHLNEKQWEDWTDRPDIEIPDMADEGMEIPFITAVYGQCLVTGDDLVAYGTIKGYQRWSDSPINWQPAWYRDSAEAQNTADAAAKKFTENLAKAQTAKALKQANTEAKASCSELGGLSNSTLDGKLGDEVKEWQYKYLPSSTEELREHKAKTEALIAKVKVALEELREKSEAKAQAGERLFALLSQHLSTCPICGKELEWSEEQCEQYLERENVERSCYCYPEDYLGNTLQAIDAGVYGETIAVDKRDATVLYRLMVGEQAAVSLVVYFKYGKWNLTLMLNVNALLADGEARLVDVWQQPTDIEIQLANLRSMALTYHTDQAQAEADVRTGYSRKLQFRQGRNPKTGEKQWEAIGTGKTATLLLDRHSQIPVTEGRWYYCRDTRTLVETSRFSLITVNAYLPAGRDLNAEIVALEARIRSEQNGENKQTIEDENSLPKPKTDPVDISKVDLSQLFGGAAKKR